MILGAIPSYFLKFVINQGDAKPARFERDRIPNGQQKQSRTHLLYVKICSGIGIHQTGMYYCNETQTLTAYCKISHQIRNCVPCRTKVQALQHQRTHIKTRNQRHLRIIAARAAQPSLATWVSLDPPIATDLWPHHTAAQCIGKQ